MDELAFVDVAVPARVRAMHRAGEAAVGEDALDELAAAPEQGLAVVTADAAAVAVGGHLLERLAAPAAAATARLGDGGTDADISGELDAAELDLQEAVIEDLDVDGYGTWG